MKLWFESWNVNAGIYSFAICRWLWPIKPMGLRRNGGGATVPVMVSRNEGEE
jgi:hypothetical protein